MSVQPTVPFEVVNGPFQSDDRCAICWENLNETNCPIRCHNIVLPDLTSYLGHPTCEQCLNTGVVDRCPICRIPTQPIHAQILPPGVLPIVVPQDLLAVGITVEDLASLPQNDRNQFLDQHLSISGLLRHGETTFAALSAMTPNERNLYIIYAYIGVRLLTRILIEELRQLPYDIQHELLENPWSTAWLIIDRASFAALVALPVAIRTEFLDSSNCFHVRHLLTSGINLADLAALPNHVRRQIITNSSRVTDLISTGITTFANLAAMTVNERSRILSEGMPRPSSRLSRNCLLIAGLTMAASVLAIGLAMIPR
jgi:hypothetical protein